MHPQLVALLEAQVLTPDEARELECYVTADPRTFLSAPRPLLEKAQNGLVLLYFDPTDPESPQRPH